MAEKILSKKLLGKLVVSKGGSKLGELGDLIYDTKTGEIIDFVLINPTKAVRDINLERDSNGDLLVPFHSVMSIGDFVIISEEDIV